MTRDPPPTPVSLQPLDPRRAAAVVPAHREPPSGALVAALRELVGSVLLVDDGMQAPQAAALAQLADAHGAELLRLGRNRGKGHAIATARAFALGRRPAADALVVVDADGQHPPEAVPPLLAAADCAELVIGDRSHDPAAMPWRRRVANRLVSKLLTELTGADVPDSQCGLRVLRGRALTLDFPAGRYESETRHLKRCLREGVHVAWVPIPVVYGDALSSFRPMRDGARVLASVVGG